MAERIWSGREVCRGHCIPPGSSHGGISGVNPADKTSATVNRYALVDIQYPQHYMEKIADRASTIRLERNKNKESEYYGQPTYNFLRLYYKNK